MSAPSGRIAIGRVLRPWGRDGAVVVEPWTSEPSRFEGLSEVVIVRPGRGGQGETRRITPLRTDRQGRPLLRIEGIDSIDAAEAVRGAELLVAEESAVRPPGESYFNHELVGSQVVTPLGVHLGQVDAILETGGANLLVVRGPGREVLIPAARPILCSVDVPGRRIVVDPPPGLVELNAPESDPSKAAGRRPPRVEGESDGPARTQDGEDERAV